MTVAAIDVARQRAAVAGRARRRSADRPLRGVFHTAGLLDDGLLVDQTPARLRKVTDPKMRGAWNLHTLTRHAELDFFVLYASVNGLLGSPAQGNYAAANVFLDALAHHRRAQGLPAVSIDWGVFAEVGMAARRTSPPGSQRLEGRGMRGLTPDEGLAALDAHPRAESAADGRPLHRRAPVGRVLPERSRLSHALAPPRREGRGEAPLGRPAPFSSVSRPPSPRRVRASSRELLRDQVGMVLRIAPENIGRDVPLAKLGMDSLMGLELRNRLEVMLGVRLPAGALWTYPTLAALSARLSTGGDETRVPAARAAGDPRRTIP